MNRPLYRIGRLPRRLVTKAQSLLANNALAEAARRKQRLRILTREFISSDEYDRLMTRHYDDAVDGPNSAELLTENFKFRHFSRNKVLGAWRWLGAFEKKSLIQRYVFSNELNGLDIGGARGPISLHVDICDRLEKDIFNRDVRYHGVSEVLDDTLDYVWSSHAFEHIPNLDNFIELVSRKLKHGAPLIALVPAYTCRRWRSGVHHYADEAGDSSHLYTFRLSTDGAGEELSGCVAIDDLAGRYLKLVEAEMVGDNSIFVVATR